MDKFIGNITFQINSKVYIKDPLTSDLGKRILKGSIDLIFEIGFEAFTFRKLANSIGTTEASVYRYFENKTKILVYLTLWYWTWQEYRITFATTNIQSPEERLKITLNLLTEDIQEDSSIPYINETKLNQIIIGEAAKIFLCKQVDDLNADGMFKKYKDVVGRVAEIILEINPKYAFSHMLVSTVIEGAHHQRFFAEHLPLLTDVVKDGDAVSIFYQTITLNAIKNV